MSSSPHPFAKHRPQTRRAQAKERTRQRLLEAARQLIIDRGFESATVRDIAAAAKLSTGAVFASFADKDELLHAVILAEGEALEAHLAGADLEGRTTRAALLALVRAAYCFRFEALPVAQATIAYSWLRPPIADRHNRPGSRMILAHLAATLRRGVERGELSGAVDVGLIAEMIWESYVANFRRAIFEGWDQPALEARMGSQIEVLLNGCRIAA